MPEGTVEIRKNRLLETLPGDVWEQLQPHFDTVELGLRDYVYKPDQPIEFAYFPINGVISMLAEMKGQEAVEVATVGNEGMVGLPLFLGVDITPGSAFSQVPEQLFAFQQRLSESSA